MADQSRFQTGYEAHTIGRDNAIGTVGPRKKRKKKKSTKGDKKKKRRGKKPKQEEKKEDDSDMIGMSDPMRKLRLAHPRHIIKLILKKLCEQPSFYRMLGTLGIALKSSGVSIEEYLLSSNNKLPKIFRNKMRYDIADQRVLLLSRILIHKMLIKEGTTLKSCIHSNGTYPQEYDSDDDDMEIQQTQTQYKNLKKGLKLITDDQFVEKMQQENPQEILNALSFKDKHRLYELFKQDLEGIDSTEGGPSELHKVCTHHVSNPPELIINTIPTIIKHDDESTWPEIHEQIDPNTFIIDDDEQNINGMVIMDDELKNDNIIIPQHDVINSVHNALGIPNMDDIKMQASAKSNFTSPSARSIYDIDDNDNDNDEYKEEEKQSMLNHVKNITQQQLEPQYSLPESTSRRSLTNDNSIKSLPEIPMDDTTQMTDAQKKEMEAEQEKDRIIQQKKQYTKIIEKHDLIVDNEIKNKDYDKMISQTYEYSDDYKVNPHKDISLLSSLQTQIDILVRYNHIGHKHLSMLLSCKPSCLPEMYVSLLRMREWELLRENEIEILENKRIECKSKYGCDIEELNIRKALLAREINETKVSLERIEYELIKMRKLYEHAKIELDEVNETTKQQELQRDAYLTKFDEKWTFEWSVRKEFHAQTKLNEAVKLDARDWIQKLEEIRRYDTSQEIWENMKDNIWKYYHDNKKISSHYLKLNKVNKSRESIYFGCINFWNNWYYKHTSLGGGINGDGLNHSDDKIKLNEFYKQILLKGTDENVYFEMNKDLAQFEQELNEITNKMDMNSNKWSYREHIYSEKEKQIDIRHTELATSELWKLVEYQEENDIENYKQYAYPKLHKFEQEQLELERREKIREIEKQKQREKRGTHKNKSRKNLLKLNSKKEKMNKLQEEDEERDILEERKYQATMQFINQSTRNIAFSNNSLPGTPLNNGSSRMGLNTINMSGRGDESFFGGSNNKGHIAHQQTHGTQHSFGGMGMSNKGAGLSSFNFNAMGASNKGGTFINQSQKSIGMDSRQGSVSAFGSRADFGRQTTGGNKYGINTPTGRYGTPTFSKYSAYSGTPTGGSGHGTPQYGLQKRKSDMSASGFGGGGMGSFTPKTPNDGTLQHIGLGSMGGSFGKFDPQMNFGMDSPATNPIQSNDSNANFGLVGQQSFSIAQKHERL